MSKAFHSLRSCHCDGCRHKRNLIVADTLKGWLLLPVLVTGAMAICGAGFYLCLGVLCLGLLVTMTL